MVDLILGSDRGASSMRLTVAKRRGYRDVSSMRLTVAKRRGYRDVSSMRLTVAKRRGYRDVSSMRHSGPTLRVRDRSNPVQ